MPSAVQGYVVAFVGGLLALLSPCGALLLPSFFAYAFDRQGRLLARTGVFYLGLITTLVPLGVSASVATRFVRSQQDTVLTVAGITVIVLGVLMLVGSGLSLLPARLRAGERGQATSGAVYLLGLVYGVTGFCTGPILGGILVIAAVGGRPAQGGALLAVYALVTGLLLIVVGIVLISGSATIDSPDLALMGARAEEVVQAIGRRIPDRALALVLVLAAGGWFISRWRAGDRDASLETSER